MKIQIYSISVFAFVMLSACSDSDYSASTTDDYSSRTSLNDSEHSDPHGATTEEQSGSSITGVLDDTVTVDTLITGDAATELIDIGNDLAIIDKVSSQVEQQSEQLSVSELEQSTEAANLALQEVAEDKTDTEAQSQASMQAESIVEAVQNAVAVEPSADVASPLADVPVAGEPISDDKIDQTHGNNAQVRVDQTADASLAITAPSALRTFEPITGSWVKKSQKIAGQWTIEIRSGQAYLVLDETFKTRSAPDLKFALSNNTVAGVNNKNALNDALFIADLKSSSGAQVYNLPSNFADYSTLVLHCEKYSKLWGAAAIK